MSKAKAAKNHKSSFKTSFKPSDYSSSCRSTSSRIRNLIPTRLSNGEQLHVFHNPAIWILIAVLLFYLSILTFHSPFDKEKHNIHAFIFKTSVLTKHPTMFQTSTSRNISLSFNLRVLKLSTDHDTLRQLCGNFNFGFELATLNLDLLSCFIRIVFENVSSATRASSSEFSIASFFGIYLVGTPLAFFLHFSFMFRGMSYFACATIFHHVCFEYRLLFIHLMFDYDHLQ